MSSYTLIADDNPDILTVLKANLQLHGFEVRTANSCSAAGEHLDDTVPDLIRKHLWKNCQIYSTSRVIDVHVQHLRQKVEKDPSNQGYIVTLAGVGCRFEIP